MAASLKAHAVRGHRTRSAQGALSHGRVARESRVLANLPPPFPRAAIKSWKSSMTPACCVLDDHPGSYRMRKTLHPEQESKHTPLPCSFIPHCHLASHTGRRTRASHRWHPTLHATLPFVSALPVSGCDHRRNRRPRQHVPALNHV